MIAVPSYPYYSPTPGKSLDGVQIVVKGNIYLAGIKTSISSRVMEELCPEKNWYCCGHLRLDQFRGNSCRQGKDEQTRRRWGANRRLGWYASSILPSKRRIPQVAGLRHSSVILQQRIQLSQCIFKCNHYTGNDQLNLYAINKDMSPTTKSNDAKALIYVLGSLLSSSLESWYDI